MEAGEFPSTRKTNQREGFGAGRGGQGRYGKKNNLLLLRFFFASAGPSRDKPINRSVD